jgi:nucleolar pre-ribosomal-associated protein 2
MKFEELIHLADTLADAEIPRQEINLVLLKEMTRRIFV